MRTATIVVPMLPGPEVSPNWHGSWRKRAAAVAALRAASGWAAMPIRTGLGRWDVAGYVMDFEIAWCCGRKRLDDDNAKSCMKAIVDGISDVLWVGQDRHVTIGAVRQIRGEGIVTVTLREGA